MHCRRCAAENPADARFCGRCGALFDNPCPACGAPTVAGQRFCNACGRPLAEAHDPGAAMAELPTASASAADPGERRHATVMFCDVAGYTALNEAHDPEDVEALMTRIKAASTSVVERHGGTVNQFVGDEVMALFGVPLARRDDPRRAVAAALALHRAVGEIVGGFGDRRASLALHTGIHTGLVVVRRSDARSGQFTLTGDTVNTAARLRDLAGPGQVVVSVETWQQVADAYEAEAGPPIRVKGKERPLVTWRIRGPRVGAADLERVMVGRDEEVREFAAITAACVERKRGRVILIRGDPGVGKSRLVAEFVRHAHASGLESHTALVLDFGAETGHDAVRSLARSLVGLAPQADPPARNAAVQRLTAADGVAPDEQLFFHDLLDLTPPPQLRALADAMSTSVREQGSVQTLSRLVVKRCVEAPLILVVDDIHWAERRTLEHLAALAALAAGQRFVLVMTTRFAGDPSAGAWRTALHGAPLVSLDLRPLPAEDAMALAAAASAMPADLMCSCVERAEGNPLFLLQLLLNAGETAQSTLPGSIQTLVHARMDRLAPRDKAALQAASVLGQRFSLDALRHLIENPTCDCSVLVEHFLVRPHGNELLFCHALIRDGAYASLLHARRRLLHARAAERFEQTDPALAAEHYDRGEHPKAALAYLRASQALAGQQRYSTALGLADRGLELATERDARFALQLARGRFLVELGRAGEAIAACRAAIDDAASDAARGEALIGMAGGMRLNDHIDEGLAALDEAEPLVEAAGLALELSRLHHLRGNLLFPLGRHADCTRAHERALEAARRGGSLEAEAAALGGLGDAHYLQGRMRSACDQFEACVALSRRQGYGRLEVANLPMVGWTMQHLNRIAAAVDVAGEAIALAEIAGQPRAEMLARMLSVWLDGLVRGNAQEADMQAAACRSLVDRLGARRFEAQLRACSAVFSWRRGDRARARDEAQTALEICREHGMGHCGPWVYGVCALVETDPGARRDLLAQGEAQLLRGCVSHNHIWLRELAIEVSLELCDWDAVAGACSRLRAYTAAEPLEFADLIAGRGIALARFGRGERDAELQATLTMLRRTAEAAEVNVAVPALDRALAAFDRIGAS